MKRAISVLLAVLTIIALFSACGGGSGGGESNESGITTTATADAGGETAESTRAMHGVPDTLDFDGGEYRILIPILWQGYAYYFFAEELNGDVMNDALFDRQRTVEEALNIKMAKIEVGSIIDVPAAVQKAVLAGEDAYDCALFHCISGISDAASNGYLYNLDTLPHIDMAAEWWNTEQMGVLRLGKKTYYAVNDYMIPCPYLINFNRDMVKDYGLDDPYELTFAGEWLLDDFAEMCRAVSGDADGSGTYDINDRYGVTGSDASLYISFVPGAGQFMTDRDADGKVQMALNTERMVKLVELFAGLMTENCVMYPFNKELNLDTGRLLFELGSLSTAEVMREYDVAIGFLPFPKYDESQDDYHTLDWGGLMAVPLTIGNPELVGAAMELMAYEAENGVIPTYYGTVLSGKMARDENAERVLDILFDTICYEIGGNYFGFAAGFGDLFYTLPRLSLEKKSTDFASWYSAREATAVGVIDKFYTALEASEAE